MIFGNISFMGFPVVKAVFGDEGLFIGAFFVMIFNSLIWTWGVSILARGRKDIKLSIRKVFINFGTVPSFIALIIFASRIPVPAFFIKTTEYLGSICTPLSMIITGALLSRRSIKQIFACGKVYYLAAFKLIALPLIIAFAMKILGFSSYWVSFVSVLTAMPCAATISMFAEVNDVNPGFAAQTVGTTSLLSVFTMPAVIWLSTKVADLDFGFNFFSSFGFTFV